MSVRSIGDKIGSPNEYLLSRVPEIQFIYVFETNSRFKYRQWKGGIFVGRGNNRVQVSDRTVDELTLQKNVSQLHKTLADFSEDNKEFLHQTYFLS